MSPACRRKADVNPREAMFAHNKRPQYTVRVGEPNPGHLEVIGNIVVMLNKGAEGRLAEDIDEAGEMYRSITGAGNDSHLTQVLYGGGPPLTNSAGVPWSAAHVDTIGEPTADLRSNIAAEARAKIAYERLIDLATDPGFKEALGFLMTREIAHQKSLEKALFTISPNLPPGKMPGMPEFTSVHDDMSQGAHEVNGAWNSGPDWEVVSDREQQLAVGGGGGHASVNVTAQEDTTLARMAARTKPDPTANPATSAELGTGANPKTH